MKLEERKLANVPEWERAYGFRDILRALVKIGVNLLAHVCTETRVNKESFAAAVAFARYDRGPMPSVKKCGFAWNTDVANMECPENAHKFRLTYDGIWHLDCAFFCGRIGATVAFPGPNHEQWNRVEVVVPLGSHRWTFERSAIIFPRVMHVEWSDPRRIAPSLGIKNVQRQLYVLR